MSIRESFLDRVILLKSAKNTNLMASTHVVWYVVELL